MTYKEAIEKYNFCLTKNLLKYFEYDDSTDAIINSNQFKVSLYFTKNNDSNIVADRIISSTIEFHDNRSITYLKLYRMDWYFDADNNVINSEIMNPDKEKLIKTEDIRNLKEEYDNIGENGMILKYGREVPDSLDIDIIYQIIKSL